MKLIFSSVFESDLAELSGYFSAQAGAAVALKFEEEICSVLALIQHQPEIGRIRRELKPDGVRSFVVPNFRNYVLFYQIAGDELKIFRVRFGGMDLPALFQS